MPIELKKTVAVCHDVCSVEEAETLLTWFLDTPSGKVNLKHCTHLHTAIVQVLMVVKPAISALPDDAKLQTLIHAIGVVEA